MTCMNQQHNSSSSYNVQFRNIACQSLNLDMEKRKVAATDNDMNFLGFEISEESYISEQSYQIWVSIRLARSFEIC